MSLLLALKADMVLATQLVTRQRAPRMAALLAVTIVAISLLRQPGAGAGSTDPAVALMVGGLLAAVAGSRPLAPGAPLASAYWVAAPWWLVPVGRLVGVLLVTLPVIALGVLALSSDSGAPTAMRIGVAAIVYPAVVTSVVLMLAVVLGSSGAATLGFLFAWFGTAPPSAVDAVLEKWPLARGPAVLMWNVLPLNWRAVRWVHDGEVVDLLHLTVWLCAGIASTGWAISAVFRSRGQPTGGRA